MKKLGKRKTYRRKKKDNTPIVKKQRRDNWLLCSEFRKIVG